METLLGKVDLEIETNLHLFDTMVLSILVYGCEVWGFEETEQIEVFHEIFCGEFYAYGKVSQKV